MAKLTKQEFQDRITAIGTCEDENERRVLLASLSEDGSTIYDDYDTAETARAAAAADIEKLRENNMKLFLQIGDHEKPAPPPTEEKPKMEYKDLFDEKGRLK